MLKITHASIYFLIGCFLLLIPSSLISQETDVLMTNSRSIDADRYKGVKGTPYMFEDWRKGTIISVDADAIEGVLLNFNGMTNGFEIKKGSSFIELAPQWYIRVLVKDLKSEEYITFQKNFLPPLTNKFTRVVYEGKKMSIVEEFVSKIETKIINNVGKNEEFKKFYSKKRYFLIKDRKPTLLKVKKKSLLALLGHKSELERFMKQEKIKLSSEVDLVKLFTFYEESGFGE